MPRSEDRKSTRLNSSHTEIYTLSLHDALPILSPPLALGFFARLVSRCKRSPYFFHVQDLQPDAAIGRSEEHTSELQSHRDLHSFPTRRSSDLEPAAGARLFRPVGFPLQAQSVFFPRAGFAAGCRDR